VAGVPEAISVSKKVMQQCRKHLKFYRPLDMYNSLYRNLISDDIAESAENIDAWFKIIPTLSFLDDEFRKRQLQYLKEWLTRYPGFRGGADSDQDQ